MGLRFDLKPKTLNPDRKPLSHLQQGRINVHVLVKDPYNEDAIPGFTIINGVMFMRMTAQSDRNVGKFSSDMRRF